MRALITTDALETKLGSADLRVLDASWHMPADKRSGHQDYLKEHIPGTVFFDIDAICDRASPYPHMLPPIEEFERAASALGIGNDNEIVVYDSAGLFSAARVWWMFRVFGHDKVRVLDGGLLKWKAEGRRLEAGEAAITSVRFKAHYRGELVRSKKQVEHNILHPQETLVDARPEGRFSGKEPEPRPGLKSGHIKGSKSLFFRQCLEAPYNTLKKPEELRKILAGKNISPQEKLAATCGSGVTACILALAFFELGNEQVPVYDGAWAEWGG